MDHKKPKKYVRIKFDYLYGPVWKDKINIKTGKHCTGIDIIDNDLKIEELNDEFIKKYACLYVFEAPEGCRFDSKGFEEIKPELLSIIQSIITRLGIINDGSFVVIDEATTELSLK